MHLSGGNAVCATATTALIMFVPGVSRRKRGNHPYVQGGEPALSIWTRVHRQCRRCPYYQYYIIFTIIFMMTMTIKHNRITNLEQPRPPKAPHPLDKVVHQYPASAMKKIHIEDVGAIFVPDNLRSVATGWDYKLDAEASDAVPLNRFLLDYRPPKCRSIKYEGGKMANMTIIIPFYNEAASLVLRTVYAVLMRTPYHLIDEIILVDDKSDLPNLQAAFEEYATSVDPKVRLVHNAKREGLIRSRQRAAEMARGEVLVFLDAQTEPTAYWYESLLAELRAHPHTVLQPSALNTDKETMEVARGQELAQLWLHGQMRTFFTWDLRVLWLPRPEEDKGKPEEEPFKVSALVGCFIIIRRDYFFHLGGFDTSLEIWGGENIELAFQAWMCGGRAMTHPCSKISHVFRKLPYVGDTKGITEESKPIQRNLARIAEVWMDEYKALFYRSRRRVLFGPSIFTKEDWRDISKRRQLRGRLQCRSFKFLLDTVIPDVPVPSFDARFYGNIREPKLFPTGCISMLDFLSPYPDLPYPAFVLQACKGKSMVPKESFSLSTSGRLAHIPSGTCLWGGGAKFLSVERCDEQKQRKGRWEARSMSEKNTTVTTKTGSMYNWIVYTEGTTEKCLTRSTNRQTWHQDQMHFYALFLASCDVSAESSQSWMFSYAFATDETN